jgi:hypothetical protein
MATSVCSTITETGVMCRNSLTIMQRLIQPEEFICFFVTEFFRRFSENKNILHAIRKR